MATYKLIQDIEAEDHILGPLSLRQFIYSLVAAFCYYVCFLLVTRHASFLLILFLPPALFCTFFAFPFGKDQSTEVWALAKLRFLFKPRKRIWDQSGVREMVTITAPKKVDRVLTNGLDQEQVRSRLSALANTIDSRGWAIKNVNVNTYTQPNPMAAIDSDRLVSMSSFPQEVPNDEVVASDDMLDAGSNPIAQQFDQMINQSEQQHRQQIIQQLNSPDVPTAPAATPSSGTPTPADYWFMNQASGATAATPTYQPRISQTQAQDATPEEQALSAQLKAHNYSQQVFSSHLRTLQPLDPQAATPATAQQHVATLAPPVDAPVQPVTPEHDPAILSLANNNDLNVATIAREASKAKGEEPPENEVVISLR